MATKPRSFGGCWTCRLRRKKCDETRPICGACSTLEIECQYGDEKPEWMDGGERQKRRAEWLKAEVKRRAAHRRERRQLHGLEVRLESLDASLTDESDSTVPRDLINTTARPVAPSMDASSSSSPYIKTESSSASSPSVRTPHSRSATPHTDSCSSVPTPEDLSDSHAESSLEAAFSLEIEAHSIMLYLDYVFPFLFPFYKPPFFDAGRGWLLVLLTKNKALFHSAVSLSGYFYGIILSHTSQGHQHCTKNTHEALHKQQGLALQWLQREMQDIITRGVKSNLVEANRVMASIVQLLTSEVAIGTPGNWKMHLGAATELFNEIMKHHAVTPSGFPCFMSVLLRLGTRPFEWTPKNRPWGSDQATLRFFTAQLLFYDTIASTALGQPPRLQQWHQPLLEELPDEIKQLLPGNERETISPHINLEEFAGVQNWVILCIGQIASLDAWKKEMKRAGSFSVPQLFSRASTIEQRLRTCLESLSDCQAVNGSCPASSINGCSQSQPFLPYFASDAGSPFSRTLHTSVLNTRIWAQAALTYLSVVLSGFQPSSPEICESVSATIEMLLSLPNPECLRTLVWPFTVTGCLASPEQEHVFRNLVSAMGPLSVLGTVREGLAILEKVWARRREIEQAPDGWDLAACLGTLGQPALLI